MVWNDQPFPPCVAIPTCPISVFQCADCRTVVGDSLALVATDDELNLVALKGDATLAAVTFDSYADIWGESARPNRRRLVRHR